MPMRQIVSNDFDKNLLCPNCSAVILTAYDPNDISGTHQAPGCEHVFLMGHDVALTYLSAAAKRVLKSHGVILVDEDGWIDVDQETLGDESVEDLLSAHEDFADAYIIGVYKPAPHPDGSYIGLTPAPLAD